MGAGIERVKKRLQRMSTEITVLPRFIQTHLLVSTSTQFV